MHEIGIVRQMLRTVETFAQENEIREIHEVVVDCGELSLVIPEYVEELYPVVVKGSILEQTRLTVHVVPGLAECDDCDEIFNVVDHRGTCPNCGSFRKTVLSGKDFTIREIVVPEVAPEETERKEDAYAKI